MKLKELFSWNLNLNPFIAASECKSRSRSNSLVRSRRNSLVGGTETGNTKPETVQSTRDQDASVSTPQPSDNKLKAQTVSTMKVEVPDINIEEPADNEEL